MTLEQQDLARQWAHHLSGLDPTRRAAVLQALQHSSDTGWPASEQSVRLLVAYADGEITARDYAAGILASMGLSFDDRVALDVRPPARSSYVAGAVDAPMPPAPHEPVEPAPVRREDAVHAYVTGQIPVGEFLRIARS
ncbi:hypothetical protein [Aeromicrobium stalagmiti]|uniref:hypothetical protein n=1 Tax=Aeromicrobium stalagmiti TaxID=2738988 RepID=UPI0015698724|nr:hypothetical protein [Aeromicrobium stalagmiti]NRQ49443.1 hypothetical protein [Aeromicrobium stalagmiti]